MVSASTHKRVYEEKQAVIDKQKKTLEELRKAVEMANAKLRKMKKGEEE